MRLAYLLSLVLLPTLASCVGMGSKAYSGNEKAMVRGTRTAGSNVTEPRPRSSRYLETLHGGFVIVRKNVVGHYLQIKVREAPPKPMFIKVHYETADKKRTISNTSRFPPSADGFVFSAPEHVPGIRIYQDYEIRVEVFESAGSSKPVDVLVQPVRSYVDTTGDAVKVFNNVTQG